MTKVAVAGASGEDDGTVDFEQGRPLQHGALIQIPRDAVDELQIDDDLEHISPRYSRIGANIVLYAPRLWMTLKVATCVVTIGMT